MLVAEYISDFCELPESSVDISTGTVERFILQEHQKLEKLLTNENGEDAYELRRAMEKIMMDDVGIFRNGEDLQKGVNELEQLLIRSKNIEVFRSKSRAANPALVNAYRTQMMIKVALTVAYGALLRTESRGAHAREDFPERNDQEWLKRTITSWPDPDQTLPTVEYEALDIHTMEMPPGFRGYGKDMTLHNEHTPGRQAVVDTVRQKMEEEGSDRFEIQDALMPFRDKLPKKYQGKNERLNERFEDA
jgi:fumarate reductase flavoprotein subunit